MKPTILPGDYLIATRHFAAPGRGDIVVFRHPTQGTDFLKRIIGLPGDRVAIQGGQIVLNGEGVRQDRLADFTEPMAQALSGSPTTCVTPVATGGPCHTRQYHEHLPGAGIYAVLDVRASALDDMAEVTVPEGHVFVLGDNRDNSIDSRMALSSGGVGFVPFDSILARARMVLFSTSDVWDRFFKSLT